MLKLLYKFQRSKSKELSARLTVFFKDRKYRISPLKKHHNSMLLTAGARGEKRYVNSEIEIRELKEDERPVKSLNDAQVKKLMSVAEPYRSIKMRILLVLGTGLRRGDIESLKISDIDFANNYITTASKKTRKSMGSRPVSAQVMAELSRYVLAFNVGQEKMFNDNFSHKRWKKICEDAGLTDLKFHDLRKTFCSMLAQNGVSTAVTQRLLEHSSPNLTNKVYVNVDPVLRHAVEQIPVGDWL